MPGALLCPCCCLKGMMHKIRARGALQLPMALGRADVGADYSVLRICWYFCLAVCTSWGWAGLV